MRQTKISELTVADPGRGPAPTPPPLPFVQTEPRRAEKLFWRPDQTDDLNLQLNLGRPK